MPVPREAGEQQVQVPKQEPGTPEQAPEPQGAEVESARLLANQARPTLAREGFDDLRIDDLADAYIAKDLGEATDEFIRWARTQGPTAPGEDKVL
jgi:hypothetical protein